MKEQLQVPKKDFPEHPLMLAQFLCSGPGCHKHAVKHACNTQWGEEAAAGSCAGLPMLLQAPKDDTLQWPILVSVRVWGQGKVREEAEGSHFRIGEGRQSAGLWAGSWGVRGGAGTQFVPDPSTIPVARESHLLKT